MKITKVQTRVLGTPWRNLTFVEVHTDEGHVGLGEVRMVNHTDAVLGCLTEAVPRHVIGFDPFDIEALVQRMTLHDYARPSEVTMSATAVIEMACWDIIGKALDQPVYRLLGGKVRDRIKAYANGWYTVERTPEEFGRAARRVVDRGYRALKVDPFGAGSLELDRAETLHSLALVEAIRETVGDDVEILIEMHGRFSPATAIRISRELERFAPSWIEEPVPPSNAKGLAKVAANVNIPVAAGERVHERGEFRDLLESQSLDIIQPDISHFGGILETRKVAATAETYGVVVAPHNVCGPVATAANLHLAACTPNFKIQEHFNDFADSWVKDAATGNPEVVDGYFALPTGPGLGITLDPAVFDAHPRGDVHFDLFAEGWERRQSQQNEPAR
ncbi:mandelate racemase/muconate lactonizing enzyme family protein [Allostreptomyces psammosilenae]|uniref:Galactonate dehydratase n=1 Tax=Allostreptomyces psammosilenae TaxID=1892865 RepID=A0A852ZYE3_9ACTN|nr:mandelate racemase/muconate lactonizing enzyme family protein [Allostreptomyces psammosilenae]NYI03302.1 galactonate dehydratase [Allostreptomyces psammosilenae]